MKNGFGGLQVTGGTANINVLSTGSELVAGWAAIAAATHGDASVVATPATGRLTLVPGTYRIDVDLSVENNAVSGLSSEDVTAQEVMQAQLYQGPATGQFPTAIAGTKSQVALLEGLQTFLHISAIVEITKAQLDAGTNLVSIFLSSVLGGDTALDVAIREARFLATRLDA